MEELKQTSEKHECKRNLLIIESDEAGYYGNGERQSVSVIRVSLDCECEESKPRTLLCFYDNEVLSASDNFKGWFNSVVGYFVQNDYRIIDRRK